MEPWKGPQETHQEMR